MVCYKSKKKADDLEISLFLTSLAELHIRWGFDKMMQGAKLKKNYGITSVFIEFIVN